MARFQLFSLLKGCIAYIPSYTSTRFLGFAQKMPCPHLSKLRELFSDESLIGGPPINAYLLPSTDAHQSEYLADNDFRVRFLSNFSGSNAYVLVTKDKALLWTDGRYFVQADKQLGDEWTLMKQGVPDSVTPEEWLVENLDAGSRIGFDPSLHRYEDAIKMIEKFEQNKLVPVPIEQNPIDLFWEDRPEASKKPVVVLKESEHGRPIDAKIQDIRDILTKKKAQAIIFSELDDVMWLLNIRGADIPYNPLAYSIAFVTETEIHLFIDLLKLDDEARTHLNRSKVIIHEYDDARSDLQEWHDSNKERKGYKIFVPCSTNYLLGSIFGKENVTVAISPVQLMKSIKNPVEMEGMRKAQIRDSAALIEFLYWLEQEISEGHEISEIEAADKVDHLRSLQPQFVDLSFGTISAVGEHAALPHYKADEESGKATIKQGEVFLLDSGGHYRDGTTDVTRTVVYGAEASQEFKHHNTLVLLGHIDNALATFPEGILGIRLDTLSRAHLWDQGLDFGHGTGHGVGHFLNVHEGPCGISYRTSNPAGGLKAGMVLTIEPGYYLPGHYGIRIENCYELVEDPEHKGFLKFKALTLAPIQKELIQVDLLAKKHIDWLNDYHQRVLEIVGKYLQETGKNDEYEWLKEQCAPL